MSSPKPSQTPLYTKALEAALRLLARRNHSKVELRRKLSRRKFPKEIIDEVLANCERWNYLNDTDTANFYIESLIRKDFGFYRIQSSMQQRGFSREQIRRSMDEHDLERLEPTLAVRALKKKTAALSKTQSDRPKKAALIRYLSGRGFRRSTVSSLLEQPELWEEG